MTLEASFGCMSHYDEPWVASALPSNQNAYVSNFILLPAMSSAIPMMTSDVLIHGFSSLRNKFEIRFVRISTKGVVNK
jgi:hypothetical protein